MTCQEALELIPALLDCELPVSDMLRLQRHLLDCNACRGAHAAETWLYSLLAAGAMAEEPPASLVERIRESVAAEATAKARVRAPRWRGTLSSALIGGILTVTAALAIWLHLESRKQWTAIVSDVVAAHRQYTDPGLDRPLDISVGDMDRVEQWLRDGLGLVVRLPSEAGGGTRAIGARAVTAAGEPTAHIVYAGAGRRISLFVSRRPAHRIPEEREHIIDGVEVYTTIRGTSSIGWWEDDTHLYIAVSTAGGDDVLMLAARCVHIQRAPSDRVHRPEAGLERASPDARSALGSHISTGGPQDAWATDSSVACNCADAGRLCGGRHDLHQCG